MSNVKDSIRGKVVIAVQPYSHSGLQGYQMALTIEDGNLVKYLQTVGSRFGKVTFSSVTQQDMGNATEAIKAFSHTAVLVPGRHYRPLTLDDRNILIG